MNQATMESVEKKPDGSYSMPKSQLTIALHSSIMNNSARNFSAMNSGDFR